MTIQSKLKAIQTLIIHCPYCLIGGIEEPLYQTSDGAQIHGMHDARQCKQCKQFFMLRPKVTVVGVTMEEFKRELGSGKPRLDRGAA